MTERDEADLTRTLLRAEAGDREAMDKVFRTVYDELRLLARRQRRRWGGDLTMNTTALVHEAYLKLVNADRVAAGSRAHFLGIAARAMRQILMNYAEARRTQKRGGDAPRISLEVLGDGLLPQGPDITGEEAEQLLELNDALKRLEELSERQSRVVECRFFGGMSIPDTADALGTSPATVKRDWALAQAWLYRALRGEPAG
jgi:RNA polymerase sigma factor (TIGR02999 family)